MLVGFVAVFLRQDLAENAEGHGGLERGAGLGDDVHVKIVVAELGEHIAQIIRAQAVADEEDLRIVRGGDGAQQLDRAARAEVGAADADHDKRLRARADLFRGGEYAPKLGFLDLLRQREPAGEVRAETAALQQRLVRQGCERVIRARSGEKGACSGEIDLDHIKNPPVDHL